MTGDGAVKLVLRYSIPCPSPFRREIAPLSSKQLSPILSPWQKSCPGKTIWSNFRENNGYSEQVLQNVTTTVAVVVVVVIVVVVVVIIVIIIAVITL